MSLEVHIEWQGETHFVGHLYTTPRSPAVSFEYTPEWLRRTDAFAIDPTALPLRSGPHHSPALFGAVQDCGPDRWGRMLIERAVRKQVLERKPYQDLDYVLALDDASRIGALRFRQDSSQPMTPKTPIAEDRDEVSIAVAFDVAPRFGIKAVEAKAILGEVLTAVSGWRKAGRELRIKASTLDAYATAFEHPLMDEARALLR